MRIYVAGPYSDDDPKIIRANVRSAVAVGLNLLVRGHSPFIPHLYHFVNEMAKGIGTDIPYETWMETDDAWLEVSDAFYYMGPSPGTDRELKKATAAGLTVYTNMGDVPDISVLTPSKRGV